MSEYTIGKELGSGPEQARFFQRNFRASVRASLLVLGLVSGLFQNVAELAKPADLFKVTNVWSVHFQFTPDQWDAMEPKGGGGMFGGPGGPGGPGGRGGPGGFGPAMFLAPVFLKEGDQNQDGKLSKQEFQALGEKWFTAWDKEKKSKLNNDQLRAGIGTIITPQAFGPPGGGGPGVRGPGPGFLQGQEGRRNGLASAAGVEFKYVHADCDFGGQHVKNVGVRYKGNGTWMQSRGSLKRSLKVEINHFVKGQKLAGVSKINFHNCVTDPSWMNEVMSHALYRDAGVPAPRSAYARVYVTVPGKYDKKYFGLYSVVEDIDNNFAEEHFGSKKGAIFKPVTRELFEYKGEDWAAYKQTYDPKTELSDKEARRVIEFAKLVANAPDDEFAAKAGDYIDLDEFARYMSVTVWLSTLDSILGIGQNYYVYLHPKTHKFQFMPWDLDHSFGQFFLMGSQEQRENLSINKPWQGENRFLERVFNLEAFKKLYLARIHEFNRTIFTPERFIKQVDEIAIAIRSSVRDESESKVTRFEKVVSGDLVEPAGFGGELPGGGARGGGRGDVEGGPRFGGFMPSAKPIKGFVVARAKAVQDQIAGKSEGQTLSGFGMGPPPGGRGGPGPGDFVRRGGPGPGAGPGGPGGPGGRGGLFGPGNFVATVFMSSLDANKDGEITHAEFTQGFAKWFESWNVDKNGTLTDEQLRAGINQDLSPFRNGPGGPGVPPSPPRAP